MTDWKRRGRRHKRAHWWHWWWPWSAIALLQRDLTIARSVNADYIQWAQRFYHLVQRTLHPSQFLALLTQYDREAEAECAAIGEREHAWQTIIPPFPPMSSLVGIYSTPSRSMTPEEAKQAADAFTQMWDGWQQRQASSDGTAASDPSEKGSGND
jgi:hypothetical protein